MTKDVIAFAPAWGYLQTDIATLDDKDLTQPDGRAVLTKDFDAMFERVRGGQYAEVQRALPLISADADKVLTPKAAGMINDAIREAAKFADRGVEWKAKGL
jgi:hypothetical protein